jgi:hypothetical protein
MPNGTLKLYNKLTNNLLVSLDILSTFNIEDNLNETPSNMKVKVITSNTYREEFQVNTVAYHEDTNTWWVIKSDESTYITTGEYEHEIQLVEYLEFYAYRHLPNCAFAPNTYDLEDMLNRLFDIAKLSITVTYPDFLDKDKIMPFFSFENFTVANAIKNISRAINAIPKMSVNLTGFVPTLTFINRNGIDAPIKDGLNDEFPIAYEKNMNSSDQFTTRSISNITNAKSSTLVISPKGGGFKSVSANSLTNEEETTRVYLPSKIDKIDFVRVFVPIVVRLGSSVIYQGYYFEKQPIINAINNSTLPGMTDPIKATMISNLPDPIIFQQINYNDIIDITYNPATADNTRANLFFKKMSLLNKFEFDTVSKIVSGQNVLDLDKQNRTIHWTPNSNIMIMPISFRDGLATLNDHNPTYNLYSTGGTVTGFIQTRRRSSGFFNFDIPNDEVLIQVGYYPIADIKVTIDNDNDAQDEKFFNQSGKVIDAVSVSKLITSHTNDSVEGTKIRNARYDRFPYQTFSGTLVISNSEPSSPFNGQYWLKTNTNVLSLRVDGTWVVVPFTSGTITPVDGSESGLRFFNTALIEFFISQIPILPLGQLVRDNNQLYVISQRSIDGHIKNGNEYYNVIYTLSRNRVARSENIVADSAVISYKTPDDNLVNRSQLYKDYIELSLQNINQDQPYLPMLKALVFDDYLAGTNFDFTVLAKNQFGTTPTTVRYVKNPTTFDLHKAKLMNVNWQENNLLGYRLDSTGSTYVQTPIVYTDDVGKATNFELLFLNSTNLRNAKDSFNFYFPAKASDLIPFEDLTQVDVDYYDSSVLFFNNFSIRIKEDTLGGKPYKKDPFEIPVFEYMIQGNDNYSPSGNIVIGNDLFSTFEGTPSVAEGFCRYHYVINNSTRFTAENAIKQFGTIPSTFQRFLSFPKPRPLANQIDLDLFDFGARNTSPITNIGFYVVNQVTNKVKFLFAINDYVEGGGNDKSNIRVYINNWKI